MSVDDPTIPLYRYIPLSQTDSIRLIELQPSEERAAPIRCNLIHTTLSQIEEDIVDHYTAISYVWGDATDTTDIVVQNQWLRVTVSLECALRHLRDAKRKFCVWADGVCIDQENIEERNQQVRQMGRIYSCATHTVMFLGTDKLIMDGFSKLLNPSIADKEFESLSAALDLLKSPWFYRIWIYQELVMSRDPKVQYGHVRCSWEEFCDMIEGLKSLSTKYKIPAGQLRKLEEFSEIVLHMQKDRYSYQRTLLNNITWRGVDSPVVFHNFTTTLASRRGFGVSDPRDMIFAHLGMMTDTGIQADYGQSTEQVFENFARRQMTVTNSLELLSHVEDVSLEKRRPGLASWSPDWTVRPTNIQPINRGLQVKDPRKRPLKPLYELLEPKRDPREWKDYQAFWIQFPSNRHLCSFGLYFCQLNDISSVLDDIDDDPDLAVLRAWDPKEDNFTCLLKYVSKKIGITVNLQPTFFEPRAWRPFPEVYFRTNESALYSDSVMEILAKRFRGSKKPQPKEGSLHEEPGRIAQRESNILEGRRITSTGHGLAIVPASTLPGDVIYILRGSGIPVVLRDIQESAPTELESGIRNTLFQLENRSNVTTRHVRLVGRCFIDNFPADVYVPNIATAELEVVVIH